ncbi:MAG: poly-gamma-glutamate hydrolase family protein [Pseudomonadota bacterium]
MIADRPGPPAAALTCFEDIRRRYVEDRDYRIVTRVGRTGVLVMAPHGGGIEPGTHIIADAVAGDDHGYYAFIGTLSAGNRALHLPSTRFDEPRAMALAASARLLVVIHGCRDPDRVVYLGGRDTELGRHLAARLLAAGLHPTTSKKFPGMHPRNLCNRFPGIRGVQLELSTTLRDELTGTKGGAQSAPTPLALETLTVAIRHAIDDATRHDRM